MTTARPFSAWERSIAMRYLFTRRSHGGVALISIISFSAIALAVAALIITMSIMNGFRTELSAKILGFNGHAYVVGGAMSPADRGAMVRRIRAVPGVVQAIPIVESEALVQGPTAAAGAVVRGIDPADLRATPIIARNIKSGSIVGFGKGEDGGDEVLVGQKLAESLGLAAGDPISIISPTGGATAFGTLPPRKSYLIGGLFSVGMSEYDQTFIYMPLNQAQLSSAVTRRWISSRSSLPIQTRRRGSRAPSPPPPGGAVVSDWTEREPRLFRGAAGGA